MFVVFVLIFVSISSTDGRGAHFVYPTRTLSRRHSLPTPRTNPPTHLLRPTPLTNLAGAVVRLGSFVDDRALPLRWRLACRGGLSVRLVLVLRKVCTSG